MRIAWCFLCLLLFSANASGQNLLWEVVEDFSGGTDLARAITLSSRSAVFVGNASNPEDDVNDFVIQSLRRTDGSTRWTDSVDAAPSQLLPLQIASSRGRVFASGYVTGDIPGSTDIVVRGYDALTGALLWNSVWDTGRDDLPQSIAAGPAAVVVVGYGGNTPGHALNFIVRAYDPIGGAVLWEDRVERTDLDAAAWSVAITWNRVFVAGNSLIGGARDLLVRAYNPFSGALVWESTRPSTSPNAIKAVAGRLFLAGSSFNNNYVGAFSARTGDLLWEDDSMQPGFFRDIAVEGNRVVAAGSSGSSLLVRSYDAESGILEWQDQPVLPFGFRDFATSVALNDRAVYIAGSSSQDFVYSEILVRGYDASTGELLWDDRSHRSSSSSTTAVDVALGKNRLFVAGYALGGGTDFVIRAYGIRNDAMPVFQSSRRLFPQTHGKELAEWRRPRRFSNS